MGACEACAGIKTLQEDDTIKKGKSEDFTATLAFLAQVQLFKLLPKDQHPLLAAACVAEEYNAGEEIIVQGELGTEFFIISNGIACVKTSVGDEPPRKVATLTNGDYFGEKALLRDEPRSATICAESSLKVFKITREKFQELGLHEKIQFVNRKAVGGGGEGDSKTKATTKPPSEKTQDERTLIASALRKNENLTGMVTLDDQRINEMIDVAWKEEVDANHQLITKGDLNADYFYIVQSGSFVIFAEDCDVDGRSVEHVLTHGDKTTISASPGDSFGELALLYLVPRAATVISRVPSTVWVIDRASFKRIVQKVSEDKIAEYIQYLDQVPALTALIREEKKAIADALVELTYSNDEYILRQGETGSTFYILFSGQVAVIQNNEEQAKLTANPAERSVHYFGEKALLNNEPREADVKVLSEEAKVLALYGESFTALFGPLESMTPSGDGQERVSSGPAHIWRQMTMEAFTQQKVVFSDLNKVGLLGCGGFGIVEMYEHKLTGDTYALKGISKGYIVKTGMHKSVINEKNILMVTSSPFVVKLYATYNSDQSLYFLLEVALGGELYATYNRKKLHGSERHAKYYAAGVTFAFEHLHERFIIYRDLKPENVLLNEHGHPKLTDMGLAKFSIGKSYTVCGTPDYFSPELISSSGHTQALDWWTLGILIFELMVGHPPFEAPNPMKIYAKVMRGYDKVKTPSQCRGPVSELIKSLLKTDPQSRLPVKNGVKDLKSHKWFDNFNWLEMQALKMEPPYKPVVKSKNDIANFNAQCADMPVQVPYKPDGSNWDAEF